MRRLAGTAKVSVLAVDLGFLVRTSKVSTLGMICLVEAASADTLVVASLVADTGKRAGTMSSRVHTHVRRVHPEISTLRLSVCVCNCKNKSKRKKD